MPDDELNEAVSLMWARGYSQFPVTDGPSHLYGVVIWASAAKIHERAKFVALLERVKDIRNEVAHFDPTPLTESKLNELRQFASWLRQIS